MPRLVHLGRFLLGIGMVALGGMGTAYADFVLEWTPVPAWLPARTSFAYLHGVVLIVAGFGLLYKRTIRPAALVLGVLWTLWTLTHVPGTISSWRTGAGGLAEILGLTSAIFMLAAFAAPTVNRSWILVCRYVFALCMPVYGLVHFLYPAVVASWVPKWLLFPLFWAYFTGVAHCAAGVAILTGVLARLAAKLFAIMLSSWVIILHVPRVLAALHDRHEWTTLLVAVSLTGAAWVLAGSFAAPSATRHF